MFPNLRTHTVYTEREETMVTLRYAISYQQQILYSKWNLLLECSH
jgi:hypothetical protein